MFYGNLAFVFEVMVYVGLGLPLVNLLMGLISGGGSSGSDAGGDISGDLDMVFDADLDFATDVSADFDVSADLDITTGTDVGGGEAGGGELSAGSIHKGFLVRFDIYCFCFSLVVMGAMGIFTVSNFDGITRIVVLAGGLCLAIVSYILVYRFIMLPLKKNNADALKAQSLRFRHAIVTFRITRDSPGKIQTQDGVGAVISFLAELDPDICMVDRIEELQEVVITDIDKERNLCYVTPAQHNKKS